MDYLAAINLSKFNGRNMGAVAGTTNTFTTTVASEASISGTFTTALAVLTNSATTPTLDALTGATFVTLVSTATGGQAAAVVFGITAGGVLSAVQGQAVPTELGVTTTAGAFINSPQFPALPDNFVPFAYTIVRTSPTGSSFVLGSTSWAASGITCSAFRNISQLPRRPQTS